MQISKWFIEKVKKFRSNREQKHNDKIEMEYVVLTDEDLRQEVLENERIYLEQCKEEDDRQVKRIEEIQKIERLSEQAERKHPVCPGCLMVWCKCIISQDESESQ